MTKCIHQIFRPNRPNKDYKIEGWGNCLICKKNEENKKCKGFQEITINICNLEVLEVKE